jgi:hypothetical protein
MSYRVTDTDKWNDTWFNTLTPNGKLLFFFLVENCDNAGVYEINKRFLLFYTGFSIEMLNDSILELKKSYIKSNDGLTIWVKNFLKYQKKLPLNANNNNHRQIISLIQDNLNNENKYKGCSQMNLLLPVELQIEKKKKPIKREVLFENENTENDLTKRVYFKKPTYEEVSEYMKEKDFEFYVAESKRFVNYFESKDWLVGKTKMRYWKSAVSNWINSYLERNKMTDKKSKLDNIKEAHEELSEIDWNEVYNEKYYE